MATAALATLAAPGGRIPGNKGIWVGICCEFVEIRWNLAHGINGESGIFFTVYYYLSFNHLVHAVWGILGMFWVLARHLAGAYDADDYGGLEALASYWHATDLIWLVLFPFFYVLA